MNSIFNSDIIGRKGVFYTLAILAAAFAVKIYLVYHLPLHDDEAYYWYWSRYPLWGYPDHGPLLGLFSAISVFILGDYGSSLRLVIALLFLFLSVASYFWAVYAYRSKEKYAKRLGFVLATLIAIIPHYYGLVLIRTDSLMIFFVFLAMGFSHLAIFNFSEDAEDAEDPLKKDQGSYKKLKSLFFIFSGVSWGFAFLAKVTTIFVFFGYALFFLSVPLGRKLLRKKIVWLHFFIPIFMYLPTLYWDYLYGFPFIENLFLRVNTAFAWNRFFHFHLLQWVLYFPTYYLIFLLLFFKMSLRFVYLVLLPQLAFLKKMFNKSPEQKPDFLKEKVFYLLLSLPSILYLFWQSLSISIHPNWTIFAAPGLTVLTAFYFAKHWVKLKNVFYVSNSLLAAILLCLPIFLSSNAPTFASDGTCLYSKYSFLTDDFPSIFSEIGDHAQLVGADYKLPSMINLYARPKKDAIVLKHARKVDKTFSGDGHSLWSLIVQEQEIVNQKLYFLGEVKIKNEQASVLEMEEMLANTYETFRQMRSFTSYCRGKEIARFYLYEVENYKFVKGLLSNYRKKNF